MKKRFVLESSTLYFPKDPIQKSERSEYSAALSHSHDSIVPPIKLNSTFGNGI